MKSDHLIAALLAGSVAIGLGANWVHSTSVYCPAPSAASVTSLFAPCQAFDRAVGHAVSQQEAVQMGLLKPDEQLTAPTEFALNGAAEQTR
jgi:hypothetical protein